MSLEGLARQLSWNFGTAETIALQKEALEQRRLSQGKNKLVTLGNQARLARSLTELDRFAEGCALAKETLGQLPITEPSQVASAGLLAAGSALLNCGESAPAEAALQRALRQADQTNYYLFQDYAQNDLALAYLQQGRVDEAAGLFENSRNDLSLKLGENSWPVAVITSNLAEARRLQGRLDESSALYRQAIARFEQDQSLGGLAEARFGLGITLLVQQRHAEAKVELERAFSIWREWLPAGHSRIWEADGAIGRAELGLGRQEDATRRIEAAEKALTAILGPAHPRSRQLRNLPPPIPSSKGAPRG